MNDEEDREDNEYNEEYAEERPKESVVRIAKIFLILLLIVALVLLMLPFLLPVARSIHKYSRQQNICNLIVVENYPGTTEIHFVSLKTESNSEPVRKPGSNSTLLTKTESNSEPVRKTGPNSEPLKKTESNSESFITKFISDLCIIPWWAYVVVIVVFMVVCIIIWRTWLYLSEVLLAGWVLTRARSQGYTQIV